MKRGRVLSLLPLLLASCAYSPPPRTDADPVIPRRQTHCLMPVPHPRAGTLLQSFAWAGKIGFEIHRCDAFPGGAPWLRSMAARSVEKGLSCLAKLGPSRREDAERLLTALLSRNGPRPKIICMERDEIAERYTGYDDVVRELKMDSSTSAAATLCDSPNYPGIYLTVRESPGVEEYEATFFHEMMHWLHYTHSRGFDFTYVLAACCFPNQLGLRLESACKLLSDQPSWLSEEYARRFTKLMVQYRDRGYIGLEAAWISLFAQKAPAPAKINTSSLFVSAIEHSQADPDWTAEERREFGLVFASTVMAYASLPQLPAKGRSRREALFRTELLDRYYPEKDPLLGRKRALILGIGTLARSLIRGEGARALSDLQKVLEAAEPLCPYLSEGERDSLDELERIFEWPLETLFTEENRQVYRRWQNLCDAAQGEG